MKKRLLFSVVTIILWVAHVAGVSYVINTHNDDNLLFAIMVVLMLESNFVFTCIMRAIWDI